MIYNIHTYYSYYISGDAGMVAIFDSPLIRRVANINFSSLFKHDADIILARPDDGNPIAY